jgi:hypothetical protein
MAVRGVYALSVAVCMVVGVATTALGSRSATLSSDSDDVVKRDVKSRWAPHSEGTSFAGVPVSKHQRVAFRRTLGPLTKEINDVYNIFVGLAGIYGCVQSNLGNFGQNTSVLVGGIADQLADVTAMLASQTSETLLTAQSQIEH